MSEQEALAPEYSLIVDLHAISEDGRLYELRPDRALFEKIAARLKVLAVEALEGEVTLMATKNAFTAEGWVKAALVRECVASLEPMGEAVDDQFAIQFSRVPLEDEDEMTVEELLQAPETHTERHFDAGEFLVQQLSLAMEPFPRKEGAASLTEKYGTQAENSPFAVLKGAISPDKSKS